MGNKKIFLFLGVVGLIIVVGLGIVFYSNRKNNDQASTDNASKTDTSENNGDVAGATTQDSAKDAKWIEGLAKALTEKGMVMYGAYWCSHCNNQKKMFGDAVKFIDYVECDSAGENANPDECKANNVEGYPTWIYQGKQYSGEQSLEKLAQTIGYNE